MSDVVEANDKWVLALLKVDPVVLRTLPNGGGPALALAQQAASPAERPAVGAATPDLNLGGGGTADLSLINGIGSATPMALNTADNQGSGMGAGGSSSSSNAGFGVVQGNVTTPGKLSVDALKQAMLDKMPLSTTKPDWAKNVDMTQAHIGREINSGSFGTTSWIDGVDGHSLVIKTGKIDSDQDKVLANCADLAHEAEFYQKITDKVGDHPNIAKCMGIQDVEGKRGLVLEGIRGKDMQGTMTRLEKLRTGDKAEMKKLGLTQPLSQSEFVGMQQFMLAETLKGLEAIEQAGIVHCDIRPANIMVDKETGGIKLVDLGIAVDAGASPKIVPIGHGSVGPEYRPNVPLSSKFDVFSAGEIVRKGMERDQFRYGGASNVTGPNFREFGRLDADGKPVHQALGPQTPFTSSKDKNDYKGRVRELKILVNNTLNDAFVQGGTRQNPAISGDEDIAAQLRDAKDRCNDAFDDFNKAQGTGDAYEPMATEKLEKALTDVERLLSHVKTTGTYAAETDYTKFVNWAMNPNPALRPSAAEAMKHPFLADALLDEGSARTLMKKLLAND